MQIKIQFILCKPTFLSSRDPGFSTRDSFSGFPWTEVGGGDDPPVSPVWQPRRRCWLVSPAFPATTGEWAGSPPLALPKERTSQVPGRKGCWELGGCLWACPPRGDRSPGSSCPPPSTPRFRRSQQQSFLKKMLVMATAPANSGQTPAHQPGLGGRRKGRSEGWKRAGLGERPDHYSTVKVARWRAAASS